MKRNDVAAFFGAIVILLSPVLAFSQTPFYQGKTITVIQSRSPGGLGDIRVRTLMSYLQKYIPGNPTIVMEFIPGGGGRKAANQIFLRTRADGLTIGAMSEGIIHSAIVGEVGVEYDLNKFNFLGAADRDTHHVFFTHKRLGATALDKLLATEGVRIGAESVGHSSWVGARVFVYFLGLKGVKFTVGYGSPELDQAILAGEVDGRSHNVQSLQQTPELVDQSNFHAIVEWRQGEKNPKFGNLPELETFAKSETARRLLSMMRNVKVAGSPYILPPNTPKDQVKILVEAMRRAMSDPGYHKDYAKLAGVAPTPVTAEEQSKAIREIPRDPDIIGLYKKLTGPDPMPLP
jgi:tripartite-type tricarboxylate transporter receptor subunit TctC